MTRHPYQVVARCTDPSYPGTTPLICTTHATSIEEAAAKVQAPRLAKMALGLYRITQDGARPGVHLCHPRTRRATRRRTQVPQGGSSRGRAPRA
ncbi:hypothetical protein ACIQ6R_26790 [Streptomyces sp. NPDC096048]|uniref:hypothetical protein n=1 Tax=Streptomyces sp. NPDC096048 TaxID=3366072 RepID=UPI0037FADF4E